MRHEADVLEVFPIHQIDDVGDLGVEIDVFAQKMRAVAVAGQRRRIDLVAMALENVGGAPPAPAAMIGAVDEYECLARGGLPPRLRPTQHRDPSGSRAQRYAARHYMIWHASSRLCLCAA